jgi:CRISPR-associated exonuclease Cas4
MGDIKNSASRNDGDSKQPDVNPNSFAAIWSDSVRITGVKVAYYHICHTKLWLFSHNINLEQENEKVQIGKQLHEDRYKKKRRDVTIGDTMSIDFLETKDTIRIHEVKKTKKMEKAHEAQLLFYLHYFKEQGIEATGVINYPLLNKTQNITLTPENESTLVQEIADIKKIVLGKIPIPRRKKICPKCAYYEFCFSGTEYMK